MKILCSKAEVVFVRRFSLEVLNTSTNVHTKCVSVVAQRVRVECQYKVCQRISIQGAKDTCQYKACATRFNMECEQRVSAQSMSGACQRTA